MRLALATASLVATAATASRPAGAEPVVAEHIAAVVETEALGDAPPEVVLGSTLEAVARIRVVEHRGVHLLWAPLTGELLSAVLDEMVNEILIYGEAARLGHENVSDAAMDEEEQALASRFGDDAAMASLRGAYDLSRDDLRALLRRRRVVRDFLAADVVSAGARSQEDVRAAVARWVRTLRARAKVRYLS